jgi:peptide-methionine (S)-S-oxide reductase
MIARYSLLTLVVPLLAITCCGPNNPAENAANQVTASTNSDTAPQTPDQKMPAEQDKTGPTDASEHPTQDQNNSQPALATFGGGCFWCTEAVLEQLDGVIDVQSGYTGGAVDNPTYEQICSGTTEHAEVVQVTFDPSTISYETLLDWFFRSHNPTTLNRQGNDVGTQYRSAIFFHSKQQHETALKFIDQIKSNWSDPIVTEVTPTEKFWPAEKYHQDYFRNNQNQGYCRVIIKPKLSKLGLDAAPKTK